MKARRSWQILKMTFTDFFDDKALQLSAALAYYAVFSLGPLLILVIGIAGLVFDRAAVQDQVQSQISSLAGNSTAEMVGGMLAAQSKESHGIMTVVGIVALLIGATGLFGQLQSSLNTIWEVRAKPGRGILGFLRARFLSFSMVLGIAFLLLISMVISTALEAVRGYVGNHLPGPGTIVKVIHYVISFAVISVLFAMIFRILPDASIKWRDVWVGAMGTALLFTVGKFALGYYLGRESVTSAYGAAGSLVVVLLWVYYSSAILFLGAEFTQVYALQHGSKIVPTKNAVAVSDENRAEQALAPKASVVPRERKHCQDKIMPPNEFTMNTQAPSNNGNKGLSDTISNIKTDLRLLLREELQLAKAELSEKANRLKRNLVLVIAGAISAYTAANFLLIGMGALIAWGLRAAGLNAWLSTGLGAIGVFLLLGAAGFILLRTGVSGLGEPLLPEKTLRTLGKEEKDQSDTPPKDVRSSDELESEVERIQDSLNYDVMSLKTRLMPKHLLRALGEQTKRRPFRLISLAATAGLTGFQIAKHLRHRGAGVVAGHSKRGRLDSQR
jgi:membrane protein